MRNVDDVMISSYYRSLMSREKALADTQQKIASGKNFTKASQSPSDAIELMRINASKQNLDRQTKRLEKSLEIIEQTSTVYHNIDEMMIEIDALCMELFSGTKTLEQKNNIAAHIKNFAQEIAQEASRHYLSKPLIGIYELDESGNVQKIAQTDSRLLHINDRNAIDILPDDNIVELLNAINNLCEEALRGDDDKATASWQSMRDEWATLQDQNGLLGAKSSFVQSLLLRNENQEISYETVRSRIEDLDIAKASIELYNAQTAFDLALEVAQRMQETLNPNRYFNPSIR